jgi:hypothetical protein
MGTKRCFVISPIGQEGSDARNHADSVLKHIVRPAAEKCDAIVLRADDLREPGRITEQVFQEILTTDFCIALLTGQNPNVFYEVAIAQFVGKPVIFLNQKGEVMPFDLKDMRCLYYDFDPKAMDDRVYEKQLVDYVRNLESKNWRGDNLLEHLGHDLPMRLLPDSYSFEKMASEIRSTLARLEDNEGRLLHEYQQEGDAERLFDGLYSSILYASRAAITGVVHGLFYGNMMELDAATRQLRVRYSAGPYNDEIITRSFGLGRRREGVATIAFNSRKIQVINAMGDELKEKGEARLNAMICIPVPGIREDEKSRQIVLLNIDSGRANVFPGQELLRADPAGARLEMLANLVARVNALYKWIVEGARRTDPPATPQGGLL